jgi:cysteine synthase B
MVDGLRNLDDGYVPPIFSDNDGEKLLDRRVIVRPRESIEWTRRLTDVGLFAGLSSGAVMAGALKCAGTIEDGTTATIVTMIADDGWKYLSTGAWSDDIDDVVERAQATIYF